MSSKKQNWLFWLAIIIIGIIILYYYYKSTESDTFTDVSEESIKSKRLTNLKREKEILSTHETKLKLLQNKILEQSEKIWGKFLRLLIISFVISNLMIWGIYYLIFGQLIFSDIMTFTGILYVAFNLVFLFCTYKFFSIKRFIFEWLKNYSYKIIAGYRDAEYFESRAETIQNRLDQIDLEIEQLNRSL